MRVKYRDLIYTINQLDRIRSLKLPVSEGVKLIRNLRRTRVALTDLDEIRESLLRDFHINDISTSSPNTLSEINRKFDEALEQEIEIEVEKVRLPEIDVEVGIIEAGWWMWES